MKFPLQNGLVTAFLFCLLSASYSGHLMALGLGQASLESRLNQPLVIHIPILETKNMRASEIVAKIASPKMFAQHGMEHKRIHNNLQVDIKAAANNRLYLSLSSREPFKEPYLQLLVDFRWAKGNILKEVTMLLDKPE